MSEREKAILAYLAKMIKKLACQGTLDGNELQSLENIAEELGYYELNEYEFRY